MPDKKLFAVFGKPVMHSLSPQIFNYLFNYFDLNAEYLRISVDTEEEIQDRLEHEEKRHTRPEKEKSQADR